MLKADGYDDCIIGAAYTWQDGGSRKDLLIYSADKIVEKLMGDDDMSYETAVEYFSFNIEGAYMGTGTPIFVWENIDIEGLLYEND